MLTTIAIAFSAITMFAQVATISIVAIRLNRKPKEPKFDGEPPLVSIVRPIRGAENNIDLCFESSFKLTYPRYEVIFCAEDESDEAIPIAQQAIDGFPSADATLLVGRDEIGANPKLNNIAKGWRAAKSDWIILSDSNTLLPPDYIERLWERWDSETGMTSMAPGVSMPIGFAASVENVYVNALQARWVLAADSIGLGYALGKALMYHRPTLARLGGLARLSESAAEDIASSHAMHGAGLKIHLAQRPIHQPVGRRTMRTIINRQVRWARLRRNGLGGLYAAEFINGGAFPIATAVGLAIAGGVPIWSAAAFATTWYGLELILLRTARWPLPLSTPLALVVRDVLLPFIWFAGLLGNRFDWRGNEMTASASSQSKPITDSQSDRDSCRSSTPP